MGGQTKTGRRAHEVDSWRSQHSSLSVRPCGGSQHQIRYPGNRRHTLLRIFVLNSRPSCHSRAAEQPPNNLKTALRFLSRPGLTKSFWRRRRWFRLCRRDPLQLLLESLLVLIAAQLARGFDEALMLFSRWRFFWRFARPFLTQKPLLDPPTPMASHTYSMRGRICGTGRGGRSRTSNLRGGGQPRTPALCPVELHPYGTASEKPSLAVFILPRSSAISRPLEETSRL